MKKALVALALAAFASVASAAVATSKHDMRTLGGNLGVCQYCHAPHWSNTAISAAPLWNRFASTVTYTIYSTATSPAPAALNAQTLTCLTCHDGSQTLGLLYGSGQEAGFGATVTGTANLGAVLSNDHPVSIAYAGADLVASGSLVGVVLYNSNVECASCHDVHGTGALPFFLRVAEASLCSACHTK
jgi:predicted CXXCH cytochrome family protein